jgi:hypothetical protein
MPTSTLLQLVARGRQDAYLTGAPQFTFFKQVYRRHTPFAIESIPIEFDGNPDFGRRISAVIPRKGDLLSSLFLEVDLPALTTQADIDTGSPYYWWCNDIGHALIEDVSIEIGEKEVDKHTGEWLNIWGELTTPADKRDGYNEMVGHWNVWPPSTDDALRPLRLTIPLRFWFCNMIGAALPLIALQAHTVRLIIHLRRFCDLWWCNTMSTCDTPPMVSIERCQLFGDYVFLETEERHKFAKAEHEYLIEQLQYSPMHAIAPGRTSANIPLTFNHCCKEFIWVVQEDRMRADNHQWFNFSNELFQTEAGVVQSDLLDTAVLRLDGLDRFYSRTAQYFRMIQPYQRHTVVPNNYIYLYSFSLHPEDNQPSGSLNASKIDDINLHLRFPASESSRERFVTVYTTNYNVFRVVGGLGGVAYIA